MFTHTLLIVGVTKIEATWNACHNSSSFNLLAIFTNLSRYTNSLGMVNIISKGLKAILPFKNYNIILDFVGFNSHLNSIDPLMPLSSWTPPFLPPTLVRGFLLYGTLAPKKNYSK